MRNDFLEVICVLEHSSLMGQLNAVIKKEGEAKKKKKDAQTKVAD